MSDKWTSKEFDNVEKKTRKKRKLPGWMLQSARKKCDKKEGMIGIGCGKWDVTESGCGPGEWSGVGEWISREVERGTGNEGNGCGNWSSRDFGCGTTPENFVSECGEWPGIVFDNYRLWGGTVPENFKKLTVRDDLTGEDIRETSDETDNIKKILFVGTAVGLQGGTVPDILKVEDKCVVQKYYKVNVNTLEVDNNVEDVETCRLLEGAVPTEKTKMDLERGTVPTRNFKCTTLRQPTLREFRFEKKEECKKEKENVGKTTPLTRKLVKDVAFKKKEEVIGRNSQIKKEREKVKRSGTKRSKWQGTIEKPRLKRGGGARESENSSEKSKIKKVTLMVDYFERLNNSKGEQRGLKNQKQENFYQQPRDGIEVSSRTFLTNFKASGRKNCDQPIGGGKYDNNRRGEPITEGGQTGPTDGTRGRGISSKNKQF